MKKKRKAYHEQRVFAPDDPGLKGAGHSPLNRQRGLKGSTLGPANAGRKLSPEEREEIARRMIEEGKL